MTEQKPEAVLTFRLKTKGGTLSGTIGVTLEQWKSAFKILMPPKESHAATDDLKEQGK